MNTKKLFRRIMIPSLLMSMALTSGCSNNSKTDEDTKQPFESAKQPSAAPNQPFRVAMSVGPYTDAMFNRGYTYEDNQGNKASNPEELQELYVKHGANEVYVRIASARKRYSLNSGDQSLEVALERAKLARELNIPLNPELALFQYNGDVLGQPAPDFSEYPEINVPGPWHTLSIEQMKTILKQYGAIVAGELTATGAKINVWNIGNEVNFGFAGVAVQPGPGVFEGEMGGPWYHAPDGVNPKIGKESVFTILTKKPEESIAWLKQHLWPYEAALMNAVREGVLTVVPDARFSTHITFPTNTDFVLEFFSTMEEYGFGVDVIGFSFYPSSSPTPVDRINVFKETVIRAREKFGLPIFIAEYAYPAYPKDYVLGGPYKEWANKAGSYEMNLEGQARILEEFASWGVKNGICGIRPWAPDLVTFFWNEFALFTLDGRVAKANPAIDAISKGIANPREEVFTD